MLPEDDKKTRMTCFRSAYTVDEKVVFRTVANATVFETFTYQASMTLRVTHEHENVPPIFGSSLGCPSEMYLCGQIGVMNSILEMTLMERYTKISESCTDFRVTSCPALVLA